MNVVLGTATISGMEPDQPAKRPVFTITSTSRWATIRPKTGLDTLRLLGKGPVSSLRVNVFKEDLFHIVIELQFSLQDCNRVQHEIPAATRIRNRDEGEFTTTEEVVPDAAQLPPVPIERGAVVAHHHHL